MGYDDRVLDLAQIAPATLRPITGEEFDRWVDLGFFEGEKLELIRGALVTMSPQGTLHINAINRLMRFFTRHLVDQVEVQIQGPLALGNSRPEPDLALTDLDVTRDALASHAHLVVEVSVTSQPYDRGIKASIYAEAEIPEYWLVDVPGKAIDVLTDPEDGTYKTSNRFEIDDAIEIARYDLALDVREILG